MFFASGDSFFAGVALIAWAFWRTARSIWSARPARLGRRFRRVFQAGVAAFAIVAGWICVDEVRVAITTWPGGLGDGLPVYVIGDSLSAANTDPRITARPELLRQGGVNVTNLAHVGATARSALKQVQRVPEGPCLILFLIGGNDVLGPTSSEQFDRDLAALLKAAEAPGRALAVCELPLPPLDHAFGLALRQRAAESGAVPIPKRTLSRVFARSSNTVDQIHLSQTGQQALAEAIARRVRPLAVLNRPR